MSVTIHQVNYRNHYRKYVPANCYQCNKEITQLPFATRTGDGNIKRKVYHIDCAKRINII